MGTRQVDHVPALTYLHEMEKLLFPVLLLVASLPSRSVAETVIISGEVGYACFAKAQRHHGGFAGVTVDTLFGDVFGATAQYSVSDHRSKGDIQRVHRLAVGPLVALDVFEYIPWASLSAGLVFGRGDHLDETPMVGVSFGLGFDRLVTEAWTVGFSAEFEQLLGEDRFPAYMLLGLRLGYRWGVAGSLEP